MGSRSALFRTLHEPCSLLGAAFVTMLGGCDPLVGAECAAGYRIVDEHCEPVAAPDGISDLGAAGSGAEPATTFPPDGGAGAGGGAPQGGAGGAGDDGGAGGQGGQPLECDAPLVACANACVDLSSNVEHCGLCDHYCPTELCQEGACIGGTPGHLVVMGMDFEQSHPPARALLGNAVFLATHDPVRALDVRAYAASQCVARVESIVADEASARNRTYQRDVAPALVEVAPMLVTGRYDLLLVHHQASAPAGALAALGDELAEPSAAFMRAGGVVVVLAAGSGSTDMAAVLSHSGWLGLSGLLDVTGQTLVNQAPWNVVGSGVASPFMAKRTTAALLGVEIDGDGLFQVVTTEAGQPVVVHRVFSS